MVKTQHERELRRMYAALDEFKRINPVMPVQQAMAFLMVALNEGSGLKELTEMMEVKLPTMSRHLIDLGPRNRRMEPGHQLVESRQDPMELRKNQYTLTLRGKHLVEKVAAKLKQ